MPLCLRLRDYEIKWSVHADSPVLPSFCPWSVSLWFATLMGPFRFCSVYYFHLHSLTCWISISWLHPCVFLLDYSQYTCNIKICVVPWTKRTDSRRFWSCSKPSPLAQQIYIPSHNEPPMWLQIKKFILQFPFCSVASYAVISYRKVVWILLYISLTHIWLLHVVLSST